MKRSEINRLIRDAEALFAAHGWRLPPWAAWTPQQWATATATGTDELRRCGLGWDVTDFATGRYDEVGLLLVTLRNGVLGDPRLAKPYAEKLMISGPGQVVPAHFHRHKMEDIIVRAGGNLVVQLWNATADEDLADTPVEVVCDGLTRRVPGGGTLVLMPGESITLPQRLYHAFWGEPGGPPSLVGEVSMVNDDSGDNRFHQPLGRFPAIEEDVPPYRLLCTEYPTGEGASA